MAIEVGFLYFDKNTRYDPIADQVDALLKQYAPSRADRCTEAYLRKVTERSHVVMAADVSREKGNKCFRVVGVCCLTPIYTLSGLFGKIESVVIDETILQNDPECISITRRIIERCFQAARKDRMTHLEISSMYIRSYTIALYHDMGFTMLGVQQYQTTPLLYDDPRAAIQAPNQVSDNDSDPTNF